MSINKITYVGQIPTSQSIVVPASSSVVLPVGQFYIVPHAGIGLAATYLLPNATASTTTSTLNIGGVIFSDGMNYALTNSNATSATIYLINV